MTIRRYTILMIFSLVGLISCSEEENPAPSVDDTQVYLAGTGNAGGEAFPTYWKDGQPVTLSGKFQDATTYSGAGFGMALANGDVYVSGVLHTSQGFVPTYWKNGKPTFLSQDHGQANDIAVNKNDVYAVGIMADGNGNSRGVIWKNAAPTYFSPPGTYSLAQSISVTGEGDVYVGGTLMKDNKEYGVYWKNGQPVFLTSGDAFATISSIAIAGDDVYAAGSDLGTGIGRYWKNGEAIDLTDGSVNVEVTAVYVDGDDVYAAGVKDGGTPEVLVWKNGTIISTYASDAYDLNVTDLVVKGSDIYVTGTETYIDSNSTAFANAVLWKNGQPEVLDEGEENKRVFFVSAIALPGLVNATK